MTSSFGGGSDARMTIDDMGGSSQMMAIVDMCILEKKLGAPQVQKFFEVFPDDDN